MKKTGAEKARELKRLKPNISCSTETGRLRNVGLFGCIVIKKPLISKKNKKARLKFAKDHLNWIVKVWIKVAFSGKSKFNLFGSDGGQLVRRPIGTRNDIRYQILTIKHGG